MDRKTRKTFTGAAIRQTLAHRCVQCGHWAIPGPAVSASDDVVALRVAARASVCLQRQSRQRQSRRCNYLTLSARLARRSHPSLSSLLLLLLLLLVDGPCASRNRSRTSIDSNRVRRRPCRRASESTRPSCCTSRPRPSSTVR